MFKARRHDARMFAIPLDPDTERRLERLARRTGRSKTACAHEAILALLEDVEDISLATERLDNPGKTFSAGQVKRELGL